MLMLTQTLERMGIPTHNVGYAVTAARELVGTDGMENAASSLIKKIVGVDTSFDNKYLAQCTMMYMVETIVKNGCNVDNADELVNNSRLKAAKHIDDPRYKDWMYVVRQTEYDGDTKEIAGVNVAVKDDGNVRRGGKQQIAAALFEQHVTNASEPMKRGPFINLLMEQAGMSKAGASTYWYNLTKS